MARLTRRHLSPVRARPRRKEGVANALALAIRLAVERGLPEVRAVLAWNREPPAGPYRTWFFWCIPEKVWYTTELMADAAAMAERSRMWAQHYECVTATIKRGTLDMVVTLERAAGAAKDMGVGEYIVGDRNSTEELHDLLDRAHGKIKGLRGLDELTFLHLCVSDHKPVHAVV